MSWIARTALVGAYVCPRGVFIVEFRRARGGYSIARSFEAAGALASAAEAAERLEEALRAAGIRRAEVAVAVRGFGVVHHVLQMPPAADEVLTPVIEREVRRLEPQLGDAVVGWISLPAMRPTGGSPEAPSQRAVLAVGAPRSLVDAIDQRMRNAGFRLLHVTDLSVAMQRLLEEFEPDPTASGVMAPLPDGAFLGFALDGALRLIVDPPLPQDAEHELPALAEEAQLGVMFVRQQFRAEVNHLSLVGWKHSLRDAEHVLQERLGISVSRYDIRNLTPAGYAALGAVLDARSAAPLSLGGATRGRTDLRAASSVDNASYVALAVALLLAGWTAVQAFRSHDAADALRDARSGVERESTTLAPIREVASQRRAAADAVETLRLSAADRVDLQQALAGIAHAVRAPVHLDSLRLAWAPGGWSIVMEGQVSSGTSARAVQLLHDLYREIPRRLSVDSVRLDELTYDEVAGTSAGSASVRFQLSFGIPPRRSD